MVSSRIKQAHDIQMLGESLLKLLDNNCMQTTPSKFLQKLHLKNIYTKHNLQTTPGKALQEDHSVCT